MTLPSDTHERADLYDERRQAQVDATCPHGQRWWWECTPCEIDDDARFERSQDR